MEEGTMFQSSVGSWDISAFLHCPLSTSWAQRGRGVQPLPLQLTHFPSWEQGPHISSTFQRRWKSVEVSGSNTV